MDHSPNSFFEVIHRQRGKSATVIRAVTGITDAPEFMVIGSEAVPGQFPQAPDELLI